MSGNINIKTIITITDDSTSAPETIVAEKDITFSAISKQRFSLASGTTKSIWDPTTDATEACSDFDCLILLSDGNVDVEMTCHEGDANEQIGTNRLVSSVPLMLGADDAYFGATQGLAGTLNVIDKLQLKEVSSATRTVLAILAT